MELSFILMGIAVVWGAAVITPGPNFFITVQTAIGRSRHSALFVVLGTCTGTMIWALSGFLGITLLFRTVPWIYLLLKLLGGAYLVYLGIRLLCSPSKHQPEENISVLVKHDRWKSFRLGLLTNLSNPKTAAFMATLFAAIMPSHVSLSVGIASVALMFLISISWYTLVALIFSLRQFRNVYFNTRSWIERVSGVIFIGFGAKLATSE